VTATLPNAVSRLDLGEGAVAHARHTLTCAQRAEMLRLFDEHFEGVTAEQFDRDLDGKDWVLHVMREGGLVGFSTMQILTARHEGRRLNVIYSGDTVMSPEAWGSPVLARAWIALVRALQATQPDGPWYWLLLSSGFRTYRFLPVFWREFWPRHDAVTPPPSLDLMNALAHGRFGDRFDEAQGVVRFENPQRLRAHLAAVPEGRAADSHVRFFLERNPGHACGDELVCLADLSDANLTAAGVRMVRGKSR
jgi:hypothetical protein